MWYIVPNCVTKGSGCSGTVYMKSNGGYGPNVPLDVIGTIAVTFTDANNGIFAFQSGKSFPSVAPPAYYMKTITRQLF